VKRFRDLFFRAEHFGEVFFPHGMFWRRFHLSFTYSNGYFHKKIFRAENFHRFFIPRKKKSFRAEKKK